MTRSNGFFPWVFPVILGLVALSVLFSGRDLSQSYSALDAGTTLARAPVVVWGQRVVSVFLLLVAAERVASHVMERKHLPSPLLVLVFLAYWLFTVAFPAVFGSHPQISHEHLYGLAVGFAAVLAGPADFDKAVVASRNALFIFLLAGVLLIGLNQPLVLDTSYTQGLLPGVPRLAGLAPHPITLGMLAQTALLCLWCKPFKSGWLTGFGWLLGAAVLFLAQSKNAWIAFIVCSACMLAVRHGASLWRRVGDPRQGALGVVACIAVIGVVLALMSWVLLGDVEGHAERFLDTSEGAQLMTLTGRDRIWAIALEEWQNNPLFGYGPTLWDADYRASIGMPNATSAHNQFMDTLARSGTVGAAALVLYAGVLLVLSLRYAKDTGGFSLALFLALALRSISEVPLLLFGYGAELFSHLLLIVTLASAAAARVPIAPRARTNSTYRVAS